VQASSTWSPPSGTLGTIVEEARARARALGHRAAELTRRAADAPNGPLLGAALQGSTVAVIAEVKRRSPSKGWIQPEMNAAEQAKSYEKAGASAISVLTEPRHFAGSPEDLVAAREVVSVPILKKDFHLERVQLLEAKAIGASAALLIVRALGPRSLREMVTAAKELSLEVVVEIRDENELDLALETGASIIGINNRNLETLEMDPSTSERLLRRVPIGIVAIAESGVTGRADVERVARAGADAVLVGSAVSSASNPAEAVRTLTGVSRIARGD